MRFLKRFSSIAAALSMLVVACGGGTSDTPAATGAATEQKYAPGGTVRIRLTSDWLSMEPTATNNNRSAPISFATYSQLTYVKNDGSIVGHLAESWEATKTSVKFKLRKEVATCADGTKVTPTVIKNSFQRYIDTKSSYLGVLFGPGPYTVSADEAAGTFTFTTAVAYGPLLYGFHDMTTSIVCPAGIAAGGNLLDKTYGSGPYTISELVKGDHVTLKLRPEFDWGPMGMTAKTLGVPDTIVLQIVANDTTAFNLLLSGGLDITGVGGADLPRAIADTTLTRWSRPGGFALNGLAYNERSGFITTDPTIRKALMAAIDLKKYEQIFGEGRAVSREGSPFSKNVDCWQSMADLLPKNPGPETGRKVLTDAGWTFANGKLTKNGQPLTIRLVASPTGGGAAGAEFLVNEWNRMGADAKHTTPTFTLYASELYDGKFEASVTGASGFHKLPDPLQLRYTGEPSPKGINYFGMSDPALDQIAEKAKAATGADVCKNWLDYQKRLVSEHQMMGFGDVPAETFSRGFDVTQAYHATIPRDFNPIMIRRLAK